MARPTILDDELREQIEAELADGIPIAIVAQNAGVGRSTLHEWISNGRVVRRRRPDPLALIPGDGHMSITRSPAENGSPDSLDERLAGAEPGLVAVVVNAAQRGSWQSAAWLLERVAPERWAKPSPRTTLSAEATSREIDPFAEVDQLAALRRRKRGG